MNAKEVNGRDIADRILEEVDENVQQLQEQDVHPRLSSLLVGSNPPAEAYVSQQRKAAESVNIQFENQNLKGNIQEEELLSVVSSINQNEDVDGLIIQVPLPDHIDTKTIQQNIAWDKDVEGVHPTNMGKLVFGRYRIAPCTAMATERILDEIGVDIAGKEVTVIGHSEIVGKPIALMLLAYSDRAATTTVCHVATKDLTRHTQNADIVISAVGNPGFLTGDMLKEGAIVIDVGISTMVVKDEKGNPVLDEEGNPETTLAGDLDLESAHNVVSWFTPVPGGVGPVTVAMLMRNTVECARMNKEVPDRASDESPVN